MKATILIISIIFLSGCSFIGTSTTLVARSSDGWYKPEQHGAKFFAIIIGSWEQDWLIYKCDNFDIVVSEMVVSSSELIGPVLIPFIPSSWLQGKESYPDINIFLVQKKNDYEIVPSSVFLEIPDEKRELIPLSFQDGTNPMPIGKLPHC